jgi:hypothetical protein
MGKMYSKAWIGKKKIKEMTKLLDTKIKLKTKWQYS